MAERLSNTSLTRILVLLRRNLPAFLTLPRYKQMHLAERSLTVLVLTQQHTALQTVWIGTDTVETLCSGTEHTETLCPGTDTQQERHD